MRRLLRVAALPVLVLVLAACDSSTDYVGLTFEVLVEDGFDWSRVASIAVELDDGVAAVQAEAAVENGTFEVVLEPKDPSRAVIAHVVLRDAAGGEVAAGGSPPFEPLYAGVSTLRVFAVPKDTLTVRPGLLPESRTGGCATPLAFQYVLTVSGPGEGPKAELYDGLTHAIVPGVALPAQPIVGPRCAEIAPGAVLVLDDEAGAQLYASTSNQWIDALLAEPHRGPTPGACMAALPEGGALVVGGRDADGAPSPAVTRVDQSGLSHTVDPLPFGLDGCRLVAFGSAVLVLPAAPVGTPYPDIAPILYDVSSGASAVLTGVGAGATSAARLADGSLLLVHREGALFRLAAQPSGDVEVTASDYQRSESLEPARIAPEVFVVGGLGLFVLGGTDDDGEDLDGGLSFGVDVTGPGSLTAAPARGSAIASLPDVGVLVLGGADAPDRVMLLRP